MSYWWYLNVLLMFQGETKGKKIKFEKPGQKKPTPDEVSPCQVMSCHVVMCVNALILMLMLMLMRMFQLDVLRMFYESLYHENPDSTMVWTWSSSAASASIMLLTCCILHVACDMSTVCVRCRCACTISWLGRKMVSLLWCLWYGWCCWNC